MKKILFLLGALMLLAACAEHYHHHDAGYGVKSNPAHTRISTPGGSIDYHCPPGQRKKGNC